MNDQELVFNYVVSILVAALVVFFAYQIGVSKSPELPDEHSKEVCATYAPITAKAFVGTEFEDFDFYQSCLLNISETSPVVRKK